MSDEPQIIKNAENYNLADDSKPQIIATGADKPDTRERLEADVRKFLYEHVDISYGSNDMPQLLIVAYEMLDRQAAITTAECTSEDESCCEACRAAQKRKIAELTVERDELRERLDAMKAVLDKWVKSTVGIELPDCQITEFQSKDKDRRIAELTAECDELREALKAFELNKMYSLYKQACMDRDEWRSKYEALRYNKEKVWCDCDCCNWRDERERLTDEVESLKRANRIQAESFQAIEYELAQAKAAKHG